MTNPDARSILVDLFQTAVAQADPMAVIPTHLPPKPKGKLVVIGAGKASARMAEAVEETYGPCSGLVITRYGYARRTKGIEIAEAAHPVPDTNGLVATQRMLDLVGSLGSEDTVIVLISGGGSALLCAPTTGVTLADKIALNAAMLASGAPIGQMNILRKHLSRVKGGQLAAACYPARVLALMISDVPGDNPAEIASGPTVGDRSTIADARAVLNRWDIKAAPSILAALSGQSSVLAEDDPRLAKTQNAVVAAPSQSLQAASANAESLGIDVRILGDALEGEARTLGAEQATTAIMLQAQMAPDAKPILLLSGGECTVTRQGSGIGGPNAELALAAAMTLDGQPGIHVLACDTDGVDGAAEVAGAYAGPSTLEKASQKGINAADALSNNDAHTFFEAVGSQIVTGPTLTNVNDFRAILIYPLKA